MSEPGGGMRCAFPPYGSGADMREFRRIYIESRNATEDVPYRESRENTGPAQIETFASIRVIRS